MVLLCNPRGIGRVKHLRPLLKVKMLKNFHAHPTPWEGAGRKLRESRRITALAGAAVGAQREAAAWPSRGRTRCIHAATEFLACPESLMASLSQFPHPKHRGNTTALQRAAVKPSFTQQMLTEHLLRATHSWVTRGDGGERKKPKSPSCWSIGTQEEEK